MSTFSTSSRQKHFKNPQFFTLLTSKCASCHNGVHFFDTFSTSEPPKVVRDRQFLTLLTSKCASRHNGVHFFDISTSKSAPRMVCFVHFHFEMCFAPQRRALFRHLNFQKCSENGVFCAFCLPNVLRATTACTFSTSQLPKVVRSSSVLSILTWKCASRHNGVHFFMSHLASWLRTRRFSEPTFRPSGASNHWKNTVFRDFPTFSRICIFFLLILSLLTLLTSAFQLSILSEVSLLNFLRLHSTPSSSITQFFPKGVGLYLPSLRVDEIPVLNFRQFLLVLQFRLCNLPRVGLDIQWAERFRVNRPMETLPIEL